jgi:hypothetical protein
MPDARDSETTATDREELGVSDRSGKVDGMAEAAHHAGTSGLAGTFRIMSRYMNAEWTIVLMRKPMPCRHTANTYTSRDEQRFRWA